MSSTSQQQFLSLLLRLHRSGPGYPPFEQTGITPAQFAYLDCIAAQPAITLQEVCLALEVSPASASNAIKHLEQTGLLLREPNPDDGRSSCFTLSPNGHEVHTTITRYRRQKAQALLNRLSDAEQAQFLQLFEHLLTPDTPTTHSERKLL